MNLVVDASVAVKWFFREANHEAALRLFSSGNALHAPDFILLEVANVFWKKVRLKELDEALAARSLLVLQTKLENLMPAAKFVASAQEIGFRLDHPIYDCLYLACAENLNGRLVTDDRRLLRAVQGTEYQPLAVHLDHT